MDKKIIMVFAFSLLFIGSVSAVEMFRPPGADILHNNLGGKQGSGPDYFHLNQTQLDAINNVSSTITASSIWDNDSTTTFIKSNFPQNVSWDSQAFFWDAVNNRLGLGTITPEGKLHVKGELSAWNSYGEASDGSQLWGVYEQATGDGQFQFFDKTGSPIVNFAGFSGTANYIVSGDLGIGTKVPKNQLDVEGRMAIGTSYSGTNTAPSDGLIVEGDMGIGTTNPLFELEVAQSNSYSQLAINTYDNGATYSQLRLGKSDTDTVGTKTQTDDGDILGDVLLNGVDNTGNFDAGALIRATQNGASGVKVPADLQFYTSTSSAITEKMRIDKDGNVGIGTTIPDTLLHIEGNSAGAITNKIENTGTGTAATYFYSSRNNANDVVGQFASFLDGDSIGGINFHRTANADEGYLTFYTQQTGGANAEKMRLSENGDLGIGTTRPDYSFEVVRAGRNNNADASLTSYNDQPTWPSQLFFKKSNSDTLDRLEETQDGDRLGDILFQGVGTDLNSFDLGARIQVEQDGSAGATRVPALMRFLTSPGGTTAPIERMTIRADGNIGIGTTSPSVNLHLVDGGATTQTQFNVDTYSADNNYQPVIRLRKSDSNTIGTFSQTDDGDLLGDFNFFGVGTGETEFGWAAAFRVTQDGTSGTTRIPAKFEFKTSPGGTTSPVTRMTINATGQIIIDDLSGSYSNGEAYVCVKDDGTIFAKDSACS